MRRDEFEIRNFYMCLSEIDFRICRQCLPSVARVPPFPFPPFSSHAPIFPSVVCEVPRHLEKGIKTSRGMRGVEEYDLYKVEVRNNDVWGIGRGGGKSSRSTLRKTSKQRPEILRFRSHSSTSCSACERKRRRWNRDDSR